MSQHLSRVTSWVSNTSRLQRVPLRIIQWIGGLSLSSIILLFILFLTTIILRRKGYGVRLGLFCIILYARPGSRRFPDGCEVRIASRIVGFLFFGCRGPWCDISADRIYMRLRPKTSRPRLPKRWMAFLRFLHIGVAAVDRGYWSTLFRNFVTRILAFWIRGLRIRVDKVRVWKDGGSWEYKAEQFVLKGGAYGIFGSKYSLSVNELFVNWCKSPRPSCPHLSPIDAALKLRKGLELEAYLVPRLFTLFRPRRMAIMDDTTFSLKVRDISCTAPNILQASITHIMLELCPGYSRNLRMKLPPSAPATKRPRTPSILRYWEGNGALHGLSVRFEFPFLSSEHPAGRSSSSMSLPVPQPILFPESIGAEPQSLSKNGMFMRIESVRVDAYGKAADERHEAMTRATVNVRGCSAGSIAVDALSSSLYEVIEPVHSEELGPADDHHVESVENIEKIVAARPEALFWIEDVTAGVDINCSKRHSMRVDLAGNGGVLAMDPVGLVALLEGSKQFISSYVTKKTLPRVDSHDNESVSSISRTASTSSLQSSDDDPSSVRIVLDMRHWTAIALGHGAVGEGDTTALVASCDKLDMPQIDFFSSANTRIAGSMANFALMHWTPWSKTTNVTCKEAKFDINRGIEDEKHITLRSAHIDWDLDVQSGISAFPKVFSHLKKLKKRPVGLDDINMEDGPSLSQRASFDASSMSESERRRERASRRARVMSKLSCWYLTGSNISVVASFPDGPKMGLSAVTIPSFPLDSKEFVGYNVVLSMQDRKCAYASELTIDSPLHTMKSGMQKRTINIEAQGLRISLYYDVPFGDLLQDWLLRLRSTLKISRDARMRRRGIPPAKIEKRPLPDIYFSSTNVEVFFEDHPLGGFLTSMLPLMQDETRERQQREDMMTSRIQQLTTIARAEIAGTSARCMDSLKKWDSKIWVNRVAKLKNATPGTSVADGFLPTFPFPPVATFVAATLSFSITMDDAVQQHGSKESIRRMKMYDDYELGNKRFNKTRHYHSDAWSSIGFRTIDFEATGVRLTLRDYDVAFLVIDRMYFDNTVIGQGQQATLPPYVAETVVGIGKRRRVRVVKGLAPTKTYADIHLVVETLQCVLNPSYFGAISEFGRGVSRFFSNGKNPSPKIPWFDSLRVNMHGRMRVTAKKFIGEITSSTSPYSRTKHFVEFEADDFEMLTSRLEATGADPFPIAFTFNNWHIRPSTFDESRRSEIVFNSVKVGFTPLISTLSGDPQDHYFVPFPSKEEVSLGGPGIGKGKYSLEFVENPIEPVDNGFGHYTTWKTGLHDVLGFDSYKDFKTESMILGLSFLVQHRRPRPFGGAVSIEEHAKRPNAFKLNSPSGASVVHTDAISTLMKVVKTLVHRPISCRFAPRRLGPQRKPPSKTGLSSSLRGLNVDLDVKDLNVVLHNNLEPGHSLFIAIQSLNGELRKRTDITRSPSGSVRRDSKLTRRRFNMSNLYSSIRVPGLDLAVDCDDCGKLLTIDKISLSDDPRDEVNYVASPSSRGHQQAPSSGFGSDELDDSPFYTFSATHHFQRGNQLDKVQYEKRLLVDRVRLVWSPARRASVFAWPDAFKEKTFWMKAARPKASSEGEFPDLPEDGDSKTTNEKEKTSVPETSQISALRMTQADVRGDTQEDIPPLILSRSADPSPQPLRSAVVSENMKSSLSKKGEHAVQRRNSVLNQGGASQMNSAGPLSPPMLAMSRSSVSAKRRYGGNLVDLLTPSLSRPSQPRSTTEGKEVPDKNSPNTSLEILSTEPKFAFYVNDCEVVFGSPVTSGIVFLTSAAVRIGIIDKKLRKNMQFGQKNEVWGDREYRFHLNSANLYTRCRSLGEFDYGRRTWVTHEEKASGYLSLVTSKPISMDLLYISSSSASQKNIDEEEQDQALRPSLLFINIPDICISTDTDEFHAVVDVVRKVLMQRMRSTELVNSELAKLRYNPQLLGGDLSSDDLDEFVLRLNTITRQYLYAGDTFQPNLVDELHLSGDETFSENLLRYKAKAKAVATFRRQDQRAGSKDALYPTMYISYSFDNLSWVLRERELSNNSDHAFVEIMLEDLVCRHIFYVGRGSSTEMTFANINAQNKGGGYFQGILHPALNSRSKRKVSRITASDGKNVAFRWYSTQEDKVGGIPVYETLTIQVVPMAASITKKLYTSVSGFIFSKKNDASDSENGMNSTRMDESFDPNDYRSDAYLSASMSYTDGRTSIDSSGAGIPTSSFQMIAAHNKPKLDDVKQMAQRGDSSILFKYVFIDALELTASYKNKETSTRGLLDFFDLFVTTPSYSYSSQVWTWKAFAAQVRKDLGMTVARRAASTLAKIKLLPGYNRAKRKLDQGVHSIRDWTRLPSSSGAAAANQSAATSQSGTTEDRADAVSDEELEELEATEEMQTEMEPEEVISAENRDSAIDAAMADISGEDGLRRRDVLQLLYGCKAGIDKSARSGGALPSGSRRSGSRGGSVSSGESTGRRGFTAAMKPPRAPGDRSGTTSTPSRGSLDGSDTRAGRLFNRLRRKYNEYR